jgi:hypothetical protein
MATMVPLAVSGGLVAALCGADLFTGSLTDPGSWARLCPGAVVWRWPASAL